MSTSMARLGNPGGSQTSGRELAYSYVLVADADMRRATVCVREAAQAFGVAILIARDGNEALGMIEEFGPPRLLITDLQLPRKDGFALIDMIERIDHRRTPIIAWSATREIREFAMHRLAQLDAKILGPAVAPEVIRGAVIWARRTADAAAAHVRDADATAGPSSSSSLSSSLSSSALSSSSAPSARGTSYAARPGAGIAPPPRTAAGVTAHAVDDLDHTIAALAEEARRISGAAGAAVYMRAPGETHFRASVSWTSDAPMPPSPELLPRVFEQILETGEPIIVPDVDAARGSNALLQGLAEALRGFAAIPIVASPDEIVGAIFAFDVKPLSLDERDAAALITLGGARPAGADHAARADSVGHWRDEATSAPAEPRTSPAMPPPMPPPQMPPQRTAAPGEATSDARGSVARRSVARSEGDAPAGDAAGHVGDAAGRVGEAAVDLRNAAAPDSDTPPLLRANAWPAVARDIARARREQLPLSVILFDAQRLDAPSGAGTSAGSEQGHGFEMVATTLSRVMRGSDLVIRWSDRQLVLVLTGLSEGPARQVAERLRAAMQAASANRLSVTGAVAQMIDDGERFEALVARADERLESALARGGNRVA